MGFLRKAAKVIAINAAVLMLLVVLVEGAASVSIVTHRILTNRGVAEQYHSRHDETLGWVALPNVDLRDHYGPGAHLRTNSQAFRSDRDFARAVPAGKTRIICVGDSFTLGFGVSNDQAWCHRLGAIDPRFETVNMGQGGYGVDQAYLWYLRDGAALDHQVLLFGFITDDFDRMQVERFLRYAKPVLDLRGDSIVITNHPVRKTSRFTRWRAANGHAIGNLLVIQLGYRIAGRLSRSTPVQIRTDSATAREARARRVSAKIFEHLARVTRDKGGRLVLVYLAGPGDYRGSASTTAWQRFVHDEAARQAIPVIDFVEIFRRVPPAEINAMFAPNSHYSVQGNEFVAKTLLEELPRVLGSALAR